MARDSAEALFGMPNTKNKTFKIEIEIKFGMEGVPTSKKGIWSVVKKTD